MILCKSWLSHSLSYQIGTAIGVVIFSSSFKMNQNEHVCIYFEWFNFVVVIKINLNGHGKESIQHEQCWKSWCWSDFDASFILLSSLVLSFDHQFDISCDRNCWHNKYDLTNIGLIKISILIEWFRPISI